MIDDLTKLPSELWPTIEELPGDLRRIARIVERMEPGKGVKTALMLEKEFRGTAAYFHSLDGWRRKLRDDLIQLRYDKGDKPADIARDCKVCIRTFWDVVGKQPVDERQLKLF